MTDILGQLKTYDIKTIHEKTQISSQSIEALLEHNFSPFPRVRFLGFIAIIEREFHVDLSSYKDGYFSTCEE